MNLVQGQLKFEGLDATVALNVDTKFVDAIPVVFRNWPCEILPSADDTSFANVNLSGAQYQISSPFMDAPIIHADPANALCSLIVELAWAQLRQDTNLLCLHGAATEFNGRLVIFPSTRRAGKSTLTVALAAAGKTVFTDDFLPIRIADGGVIRGVSSGIAPRLRLPVPAQIGATTRDYIKNRSMIANRQYQFVAPNPGELANFGDTAPIGSLVFLERAEGAQASIEPVSEADTLERLIKQNFSRAMNAAGILKMLSVITRSTPAFRLTYNDVDQAVALLETSFETWDQPAPTFTSDIGGSLFGAADEVEFTPVKLDVTDGTFLQAQNVEEVSSEGKRFLTGQNGRSIHHLNGGAANIWRLLQEPTSVAEAIEMLCAVFPEHPPEDIRRDVIETFTEFANNGLLQKVDASCHPPEIEANLPA